MTPIQVEEMLDQWPLNYAKAFKFMDFRIFNIEYLVIDKKDAEIYKVDEDRSTIKIGPFNRREMVKMLGSSELQLINDGNWHVNYKETQTGGCTCGAWRVKTSHAFHCKLYGK